MSATFDSGAGSTPPARESLREQVARRLRAALITGQLRPGEVYSAPGLAEEFKVSVTPVREAMLDLVRENLVVPVRNRGFRVVRIDDRALDECIALRQLIEPPTIAAVTTAARLEDIRSRRADADAVFTAIRAGDLPSYIDADLRFHLGLLQLSGNRILVDTVRDLRYRSRLFAIPKLVQWGMLEPSAAEHLELIELMEARDSRGAESLMRHHLDHVRGMWAGQ